MDHFCLMDKIHKFQEQAGAELFQAQVKLEVVD